MYIYVDIYVLLLRNVVLKGSQLILRVPKDIKSAGHEMPMRVITLLGP